MFEVVEKAMEGWSLLRFRWTLVEGSYQIRRLCYPNFFFSDL